MSSKCGETRCRFVIDVGKRPNGKRDQRCYTYTKWEEARAARVKIIADPWSGRSVRLRRLSHLARRFVVLFIAVLALVLAPWPATAAPPDNFPN
jgi:hypothetical protein